MRRFATCVTLASSTKVIVDGVVKRARADINLAIALGLGATDSPQLTPGDVRQIATALDQPHLTTLSAIQKAMAQPGVDTDTAFYARRLIDHLRYRPRYVNISRIIESLVLLGARSLENNQMQAPTTGSDARENRDQSTDSQTCEVDASSCDDGGPSNSRVNHTTEVGRVSNTVLHDQRRAS